MALVTPSCDTAQLTVQNNGTLRCDQWVMMAPNNSELLQLTPTELSMLFGAIATFLAVCFVCRQIVRQIITANISGD